MASRRCDCCTSSFLLWSAIFFSLTLFTFTSCSQDTRELVVFTVATAQTDGFNRFIRSADKYGYNIKVLGMGMEWRGGDIANYPGGGFKVNLLKDALMEYKDRDDVIVMFVDSYDVVFSEGPSTLLKAFDKFASNVVFSAEGFCWPDRSLAEKYPKVKMNEKRFLNSGGFIGVARPLYDIVTSSVVADQDDDQLFYTNIFLDLQLREKYSIKLDTRSEIFQNLNGALDDVSLKFKGSKSYLYNMRTGNIPVVVHGNGPIKNDFNRLTNYLADQWSPMSGCQACKENTISLRGMKEEEFPEVFMGLFVTHPTPFVDHFLERIASLNYPKSKISVFIYNAEKGHSQEVDEFVSSYGDSYKSVMTSGPGELNEWNARNKGIDECLKVSCKYYFSVDSDVQLELQETLALLIQQNRSVIAPMVRRPKLLWSNFWGALTPKGYYARSDDYMDIAQGKKLGLWNVPYVSGAYLIHGPVVEQLQGAFISRYISNLDADMAVCERLRELGVFMHVWNEFDFGYLINSDTYKLYDHLHADMWEIWNNRYDWEKKYIHAEYQHYLNEETEVPQPCPDVYWFPIMSLKYTKHLREEMEHFGEWSGGSNQDTRLAGGYENVPTRDIHMNQINYEQEWLYVLQQWVQPMQQKVFLGYYSDPPRAIMNFVVRYRPDEQASLRPHHDSSTYTINVALNQVGVDYEGGGARFIRSNCSVILTKEGWAFIHPGRLTHYHEGLTTTAGTRYIMVSFIDP